MNLDTGTDSAGRMLTSIDDYAHDARMTRKTLARELQIPYSTVKKWFSKAQPKRVPSGKHLERVADFLAQKGKTEKQLGSIWLHTQEWWRTQHKFRSIAVLAEEIGWNPADLAKHFETGESPPPLVLEKLAAVAGLVQLGDRPLLEEARRRAEKVKYLLLILHDELAWFRDSSQDSREVFRGTLSDGDIGYLASLLTMICDEQRFATWLALTTNRFNYFREIRRQA